jgi:hypothetical protein
MIPFLTPGKDPEKIALCEDQRVIFENHDGVQTDEHGRWDGWTTSAGIDMLTLSFHCKGDERPGKMMPNLFHSIIPGIHRSSDNWQVLLEPDKIGETNVDKALVLDVSPDEIANIKHVALWLHPRRPPAVLTFTYDGQIVYHRSVDGKTFASVCEPNGTYRYERHSENEEYFVTSYHHQAKPTDVWTVLRRSDGLRPCFRAVSDAKTTQDEPRVMQKWHIVMVLLSLNVNVILGTKAQ